MTIALGHACAFAAKEICNNYATEWANLAEFGYRNKKTEAKINN